MPSEPPFTVPHPRPTRLTNRGCCWSGEELNGILAKADADLDWRDYRTLFENPRCTGTYEELVYFLPWGLAYLGGRRASSSECRAGILGFISYELDRMAADMLAQACQSAVIQMLDEFTAEFKPDGWDVDVAGLLELLGGPPNQAATAESNPDRWDGVVTGLLEDLLRRPNLAAWGEEYVESLAGRSEATRSAWLLEVMRFVAEDRTWHAPERRAALKAQLLTTMQELFAEIGRPEWLRDENETAELGDWVRLMTEDPAIVHRSARIAALVDDTELLQRHLDRLKASDLIAKSPPGYWLDLATTLNLRL